MSDEEIKQRYLIKNKDDFDENEDKDEDEDEEIDY